MKRPTKAERRAFYLKCSKEECKNPSEGVYGSLNVVFNAFVISKQPKLTVWDTVPELCLFGTTDSEHGRRAAREMTQQEQTDNRILQLLFAYHMCK